MLTDMMGQESHPVPYTLMEDWIHLNERNMSEWIDEYTKNLE